jgi:glycosyltransferase involved in cell wall biosynthesis
LVVISFNLRIDVRIFSGGYVADPAQALAEVDVVINLSRFQESFGRTVLEAMASARPVVGYAWGALPELVVNSQTGFLVPFGDTEAVAARLLQLQQRPELKVGMGLAGRERALACFSGERLRKQLARVYGGFGLVAEF